MKSDRSYSLTRLISLTLFLLFFTVVILSTVYSVYFFRSSYQRTVSIYEKAAEDDAAAVSDLLSSVSNQLGWIVSELKNSSIESETEPYDRVIHYEALSDSINSALRVSEVIDSILIFPKNTDLLIEAHSMPEDRFLSFVDSYSDRLISSSFSQSFLSDPETGERTHLLYSSQVKKLNTNALSSIPVATVYVTVPIGNLMSKVSSGNGHILCYERGRTLIPFVSDGLAEDFDLEEFSVPDPDQSSIRIGAGRYNLIRTDVGGTDFQLLTLIPYGDLSGRAFRIAAIISVVLLGLLALTLFGVRYITRRMHVPVNNLVREIKTIGSQDEDYRLPDSPAKELTEISMSVNQMLDELQQRNELIRETRENLSELQLLHKESQLRALQSQINPHFLYNTLGCIRSLAMKNETDKISDILNSIITIYRYGASGSSLSTVGKEFDCCGHYANIMRYRFGNRYTFRFSLDPRLESVQVPRMILQPLLENAVNHGYGEATKSGIVEVKASSAPDGTVTLSVKDYGCGIGPEELVKLENSILRDPDPSDPNEQIGMRNVHQRIRRMFGDGYGMKIESVKDGYTEVSVSFPSAALGGDR